MAWFVVTTTLGYITYFLFPAVPPWLASQRGELVATHRIVRELWDYLGRHDIASAFSGSNVLANDVAAIPSLHGAYPVMIAAFFWRRSAGLARSGLALYAAAMAFGLVYAAEHYVVDIVLGWLYVAGTGWALWRFWPPAASMRPGLRATGARPRARTRPHVHAGGPPAPKASGRPQRSARE